MQHSGYFVDTNLLVLLVVGNVDCNRIMKHNRTRSYTVKDYKKLCEMLVSVKQILVTPNILTETYHLLRDDKRMVAMLRSLIQSSCIKEIYIDSQAVTKRDEFEKLGLTDCGLLEAATPKTPLLSNDFTLISTARKLNSYIAIHFHSDDL